MSDLEYYRSLIAQGMNPHDAARETDWSISCRVAKMLLVKKGIQREPTETEVEAVFLNI